MLCSICGNRKGGPLAEAAYRTTFGAILWFVLDERLIVGIFFRLFVLRLFVYAIRWFVVIGFFKRRTVNVG